MWSRGDNPHTCSFIFSFSFNRCTAEPLFLRDPPSPPPDLNERARQLCLGRFLSTVKSQICRVWCHPRSEGPCWFFLAPLGPEAPASLGTGMWEALLCNRRDQSGEVQPPNCQERSVIFKPALLHPSWSRKTPAGKWMPWAVLGPQRGDRMGGWGGRGVGQRWGCLMSMSQPGGCLTQSSPLSFTHILFYFFNHNV